MGGLVVNCKKCNKVFQQRLHPICPECMKLGDEQFTLLYRKLQESASYGGIDIDVLADFIGMPEEDIEKYYLEGRLSTAGIYLKMPCHACGVMCGEQERRGRYCHKCSEIISNLAGVDVKPLHEVRQDAEAARKQELQDALLKKNIEKSLKARPENRFGSFARR